MSQERIIHFMKYRQIAMVLSIAMVIVSIGSLIVRGINFGLDFTGGTQVEVAYEKGADLPAIRSTLAGTAFDDAVVTAFGSDTDVLIRIPKSDDAHSGDRLYEILQAASDQNVELSRVDYVGPQVGDELRDQGGIGLLVALLCVMMYVAFRFQFKFSVGAVVALIHDVIITLGIFSLLQLDFDLTVLAALLAVIGYSLNDTIVVSDRIRENFRKLRKGGAEEIIDVSLTQTLGRTLVTSITTLLVLASLFLFGGEQIHGFATALIIGVLVGTYSSVYVAANILMLMNVSKEDLIEPEKEGAEFDEMP